MSILGDLERLFAASLYPLRIPIAIGVAIGVVGLLLLAQRRGWPAAARRHPLRTGALAAVLLAFGAPAAWYLGSPLLIRTTLDEPGPAAVPSPEPSGRPSTASPPPLRVLMGRFTGADEFHFASGEARLIETSPGTWVLRFEDFSVRNGPDLYVYLSPDPHGYADGALELGTLRATDGSFNIEVPAGTDVSRVRSVVIWCRAFAVQFGHATLVASDAADG